MKSRFLFFINTFSLICITLLLSCSRTAPLALFKRLSPHDAYGQKLKDAGLDRTAMGGAWLQTASQINTKALTVTIPYKESGYFSADKIPVSVLRFEAKQGQKLHVSLSKRPEFNFNIYIDIFQEQTDHALKLMASADTAGLRLDYEVPKTSIYQLRLQPELLRSGEYTLTITAGPSLSFPVSVLGKPHIGSFWGDNRDEGGRRHEGVDIFATKHTPAIAAADGIITRVTTNTLGGKVVFMRPDGKDYNTYYAHLDSQLVKDGQTVRTGDTLGLVGNTGNARTAPSHLHFGVYTSNGAIDPLPFINREVKAPQPITASEKLLNSTTRTVDKTSRLRSTPAENATAITSVPMHTILQVESATHNWFKVSLPDGRLGFVRSKAIVAAYPLRKEVITSNQPLYDEPDTTAARKLFLPKGSNVSVLGGFKNFYLISDTKDHTGWIEVK